MSEYFDMNEGFKASGSSFVLHPDDYECLATITKVEIKRDVMKNATAVVFSLEADGARFSEYVSLRLTERYTREIVTNKFSSVFIACGIVRDGMHITKLMEKVNQCQGRQARVTLGIRKYQSSTTGNWIEINEVKRWHPPAASVAAGTSSPPPTVDDSSPYTFG